MDDVGKRKILLQITVVLQAIKLYQWLFQFSSWSFQTWMVIELFVLFFAYQAQTRFPVKSYYVYAGLLLLSLSFNSYLSQGTRSPSPLLNTFHSFNNLLIRNKDQTPCPPLPPTYSSSSSSSSSQSHSSQPHSSPSSSSSSSTSKSPPSSSSSSSSSSTPSSSTSKSPSRVQEGKKKKNSFYKT